jgi:hypothetical protein
VKANHFDFAAQQAMPSPGEVLQESIRFADRITGRQVLQLTSKRDFNQKPTYHIGSGFSGDSRYLPIVTIFLLA